MEGLGAVEVESMGRAESSDGEKCERKLLAVQYSMVSLEGGEGVSCEVGGRRWKGERGRGGGEGIGWVGMHTVPLRSRLVV